jgi:hypothetical protein
MKTLNSDINVTPHRSPGWDPWKPRDKFSRKSNHLLHCSCEEQIYDVSSPRVWEPVREWETAHSARNLLRLFSFSLSCLVALIRGIARDQFLYLLSVPLQLWPTRLSSVTRAMANLLSILADKLHCKYMNGIVLESAALLSKLIPDKSSHLEHIVTCYPGSASNN